MTTRRVGKYEDRSRDHVVLVQSPGILMNMSFASTKASSTDACANKNSYSKQKEIATSHQAALAYKLDGVYFVAFLWLLRVAKKLKIKLQAPGAHALLF